MSESHSRAIRFPDSCELRPNWKILNFLDKGFDKNAGVEVEVDALLRRAHEAEAEAENEAYSYMFVLSIMSTFVLAMK